MNYPKAIVIAVALIAGAIVFSAHVGTSKAQGKTSKGGRYRILDGRATSMSRPAAWRVNVETGQMIYCMAVSPRIPPKSLKTWKVQCIDSGGPLPLGSY